MAPNFPTVDLSDLPKRHQKCPLCRYEYCTLLGSVEKPVVLPCKHVVGNRCLHKVSNTPKALITPVTPSTPRRPL